MYAAASISTPAPREPAVPALERRDDIGIDQLRAHVNVTRRKLAAGQYVYRAGQPFNALFLVNVGFLKTCELTDDGREQVTGFRMRGDLIGAESIGMARYACDVIALEDSEVWELPYPPMLTACLQVPELQARLTEAMAREIRHDRVWMLVVGTLGAESRVAAFLLDLADRQDRPDPLVLFERSAGVGAQQDVRAEAADVELGADRVDGRAQVFLLPQ